MAKRTRIPALLLCFALILSMCAPIAGLAEEKEMEKIPLYPEGNVVYAYDAENNPTKVTEITFFRRTMALPTVEPYDPYLLAFPVENPIYTVVILPGSGYYHMNSLESEGTEIAEKLNERHISCFVVAYRISPSDLHAIMADSQRAMRYVRYHAEEYGVDPDKIAIMGFSAGGHLALMTCEFSDRPLDDPRYVPDEIDRVSAMPNACLLGYPVVTMEEGKTFEPGAQVFLNGDTAPESRAAYSAEAHLPENMVPTFIWLCADDMLVPNINSLSLAIQLNAMKIPYELHLFQNGGHGVGLGQGKVCEGWFDLCVRFIERLSAAE